MIKGSKFKYILELVLLTFVYLLLGIWFTWPLALHWQSQIPNNLVDWPAYDHVWGDHLHSLAQMRELKNHTVQIYQGAEIYTKEACMYELEECKISRPEVIFSTIFSPYILHLPPSFFLTDIEAYNFSIWFSFVLCGLASYVLAKLFVFDQNNWSSRLCAFFASLFVTIFPKRIHHLLVGQRNGWMIGFWIIFWISFELELSASLKSRFAKIANRVILVYTALIVGIGDPFLAYYGLVAVGLRMGFEYLRSTSKTKVWYHNLWDLLQKSFWVLVSQTLVIFYNIYIKFDTLLRSEVANGRPWEIVRYHSPPISNLWIFNQDNHEWNIYLGLGSVFLVLAICILGLGYFRYKKYFENYDLKLLAFCTFCILFFLYLALGDSVWGYDVLYGYLPGLKFSRTPTRALFTALPFLVILVTMVTQIWMDLIRRAFGQSRYEYFVRYSLFMILIFSTLVSFMPRGQISLVELPKTYKLSTASNQKVLFLPFFAAHDVQNSLYEYYLSRSNNIALNSYHPYIAKDALYFESQFGTRLNTQDMTFEDWYEIVDQHKVDRIILFRKYFEDPEFFGTSGISGYEMADIIYGSLFFDIEYSDEEIVVFEVQGIE